MPLRQPLRLKKPGARARKPLPLNPLASTSTPITAPLNGPAAPAKPAGLPPLNPYPDLTLAIAMLKKRADGMELRNPSDSRLELVRKWLNQLTKLQADMQQLHKLELLTQRLQPASGPNGTPTPPGNGRGAH